MPILFIGISRTWLGWWREHRGSSREDSFRENQLLHIFNDCSAQDCIRSPRTYQRPSRQRPILDMLHFVWNRWWPNSTMLVNHWSILFVHNCFWVQGWEGECCFSVYLFHVWYWISPVWYINWVSWTIEYWVECDVQKSWLLSTLLSYTTIFSKTRAKCTGDSFHQ